MKVSTKKSQAKTANVNSLQSAVDLEEQIRRRAYELYERRGREAGHEVEDWLQAEAELASERTKPLAGAAVKTSRKPPVTRTDAGQELAGRNPADAGKRHQIIDTLRQLGIIAAETTDLGNRLKNLLLVDLYHKEVRCEARHPSYKSQGRLALVRPLRLDRLELAGACVSEWNAWNVWNFWNERLLSRLLR